MIALVRQLRPVAGLFVSGSRAMLLIGVVLSAVTAVCGVALLGLSGWFITATGIAGLSAATALAFDVFVPSAGIRFLALARTAARYGERLTTHEATLAVLADLRERLFRGWARRGAARELLKRPARLLFRLTLDIDALDSLYLRVFVPLFGACAVAVVTGVVLGLMQPLVGLCAAGFLILAGLGLPVVAAMAARRHARRRAHGLEVLRSRVIDLVSGQSEWIMAGQLAARREGLTAADGYLAACDDVLNRIEVCIGAGFMVAGALLLAATLVAMAWLAEQGIIDAPLAALGLLVALAAIEPFAALRRGAIEFGRTLVAVQRIAPRLSPAVQTAAADVPPAGVAARLDGVIVRHPGAERPALGAVSLTIAEGERIAIVGPSGAGKSTLLGLLAGEVAPQEGRVSRRAATLLTQRTELFQDSLRDNLRLADPQADDARLMEVLEAAGLREDVEALPQGLDTRLGEGGHGLSGGQARRLAFARLLLRPTTLWLLDEPTEGLDGATARDVLTRLWARAAGRTVVVATHIRREAEAADRLIIMEGGIVTAIVTRGDAGFDAALAALRPD
ncbi:thiol reductant ABC exporter subunit CydC [Chelatococcus composti]|uniref:ATP-binding cassette subfamily C protein CydC n=1 Tax=Chelatococcus composti TaxID=1743235 RepID=A0A841KDH5_9HYPH|nr:thiol reductant ABC exporter subunit CydC [Chelatococcus composti]MBB6168984.1 ATP-binding cassette subfamily C protein CydC [Chelatococcus composti]MBS7737586.1 thiol reductant ABC exporter subunit CydC [Chelatococcus composti]GGG44379.1 ABC transporter permease [Chelatococcus composti]